MIIWTALNAQYGLTFPCSEPIPHSWLINAKEKEVLDADYSHV